MQPCQILRLKRTKFDFGWGSASDPAPSPLAGFKGPTSKEGTGGEGKGRVMGGEGKEGRGGEGKGEVGREGKEKWDAGPAGRQVPGKRRACVVHSILH